ncbi:MAG: hypothetical protein KY469_06285 [Actinobacteria bacterium]|nr:hypothetical protein [Actinomycetota bacterium]
MGTDTVITLFDELDQDWSRQMARGEGARALTGWRQREPRLGGFDSVQQLMRFLGDRRQDPEDQSDVLLSLLEIGRGDALALRLVLQRFVPALKRIASWDVPFTQPDWNARVVSAAYDVIASYPVEDRPRAVSVNIVWDIRKRLFSELDSHRCTQAELLGDLPENVFVAPDPSQAVEAAAMLRWAVRRARVAPKDAFLIAVTRVAGVPLTEVAAKEGVPCTRLRQQRLRVERQMRRVLSAA